VVGHDESNDDDVQAVEATHGHWSWSDWTAWAPGDAPASNALLADPVEGRGTFAPVTWTQLETVHDPLKLVYDDGITSGTTDIAGATWAQVAPGSGWTKVDTRWRDRIEPADSWTQYYNGTEPGSANAEGAAWVTYQPTGDPAWVEFNNRVVTDSTVVTYYAWTDGVECAVVPPPPAPPVDVCSNLPGNQSEMPDRYTASDGICTTPVAREPVVIEQVLGAGPLPETPATTAPPATAVVAEASFAG